MFAHEPEAVAWHDGPDLAGFNTDVGGMATALSDIEIARAAKKKPIRDVAARLGISLENAHRANDDAEAALRPGPVAQRRLLPGR